MNPECERRMQNLEDTVYGTGGRDSIPTRLTLLEASLSGIKEGVDEIKKGLEDQNKQRAQGQTAVRVAMISALAAVLCSALSLVGMWYRPTAVRAESLQRPAAAAPAPAQDRVSGN